MRTCQYEPCGKPLPKGCFGQRKYHAECAKKIVPAYQRKYRMRKLASMLEAMSDDERTAFLVDRTAILAGAAARRSMSPEERRADSQASQRQNTADRISRNVPCFVAYCDNIAFIRLDGPDPVCEPCYKQFRRFGRYSRGGPGSPCGHCGKALPVGSPMSKKYHEECAVMLKNVRSAQWRAELSGKRREAHLRKQRKRAHEQWFAMPIEQRKAHTKARMTPKRREQMRKSMQSLHERRIAMKVPCSVDGCLRLATMSMDDFPVCKVCYNQKRVTGSYGRTD